MQRPDAVEAIRTRYEHGFESNVSDDDIRRELWKGWGTLLAYIEQLERALCEAELEAGWREPGACDGYEAEAE